MKIKGNKSAVLAGRTTILLAVDPRRESGRSGRGAAAERGVKEGEGAKKMSATIYQGAGGPVRLDSDSGPHSNPSPNRSHPQ